MDVSMHAPFPSPLFGVKIGLRSSAESMPGAKVHPAPANCLAKRFLKILRHFFLQFPKEGVVQKLIFNTWPAYTRWRNTRTWGALVLPAGATVLGFGERPLSRQQAT
jgi:hypothetical protein